MKKIIPFILAFIIAGGIISHANAQVYSGGTIPLLSPWIINGSTITPRDVTKTLTLPNLAGTGVRCIHTDNLGKLTVSSADCGSGSGGSSGGTFSTSTSQTPNILTNHPNNNTDVVTIGSNSTTTAPFYFDPNTKLLNLSTASLMVGNALFGGKFAPSGFFNTNGYPQISVGANISDALTFITFGNADMSPYGSGCITGVNGNTPNSGGAFSTYNLNICMNGPNFSAFPGATPNSASFSNSDGDMIYGALSSNFASSTHAWAVGPGYTSANYDMVLKALNPVFYPNAAGSGVLSLGSTTPWSDFTIVASSTKGIPFLTVASSTNGTNSAAGTVPQQTLFQIDATGRTYVGGAFNASTTISTQLGYDSLNDGLVFLAPLSEGSTTATTPFAIHDYSQSAQVGTASGNTYWTKGNIGNALIFDGSTSKVIFPNTNGFNVPVASSSRSFVIWIKKTDATLQFALDTGVNATGQRFGLGVSNKIYFSGQGADCIGTAAVINDGNWHMEAVTYTSGTSGTTIRTYDDAVAGTACSITNLNTGASSVYIGVNKTGAGEFWNGSLQRAMIYNRVLSQQDLTVLYSRGVGGTITTPVSVANGGTGTTTALNAAKVVGVQVLSPVGGGDILNDPLSQTPSYAQQIGTTNSGTKINFMYSSGSTVKGDWYHGFGFLTGIGAVGASANMDPLLTGSSIWALNGSNPGYIQQGDSGLIVENFSANPLNSGTSLCTTNMGNNSTGSSTIIDQVGSCLISVPANRASGLDPAWSLYEMNRHRYVNNGFMIGSPGASDVATGLDIANYSYLVADIHNGLFRIPKWVKDVNAPDQTLYTVTVSGITTVPLSGGTTYNIGGNIYTVDTQSVGGVAPNISGTFTITGTSTPPTSGTMTKAQGDLQAGDTTITYTNAVVTSVWADTMIANPQTGQVAFGTTTPYAKHTIWGDSTGKILEVVTSASSTALAVSATGNATTTLSGLNISGVATSTSNVGFNLTAGCYAINGTCISGGGGSGSGTVSTGLTGQNAFYASNGTTVSPTSTIFITPNSQVAIGTTTSSHILDVWGTNSTLLGNTTGDPSIAIINADQTNGNYESLGFLEVNSTLNSPKTIARISGVNTNHTAGSEAGDMAFFTTFGSNQFEQFRLTSTGNAGFGTTSPYARLSVAGTIVGANIIATSTTATSTLQDTNVGTGTGTFNVDYNGYVGISTSTVTTGGAQATSALLNLGNNPATTNSSTTILMNKLQWDGLDSGGTRRCTFINSSGALTTITGKCNN